MRRLPLIMLVLVLIPSVIAANEAAKIEMDSVNALYSAATDLTSYADGLDPMPTKIWNKESSATLKEKLKFFKLAETALSDIAEDPDYRKNAKNLPFSSTYGKAVTALERLRGKISDLEELVAKDEKGDINEDGKIDGSRWWILPDKKFDNKDFKAKLLEPDDSEKKVDHWYTGYSLYAILIVLGVIGFLMRKPIVRIGSWGYHTKKNSKVRRKLLDKSDKKIKDLIDVLIEEGTKAKNAIGSIDQATQTAIDAEIRNWLSMPGVSRIDIKAFKERIGQIVQNKDAKKSIVKMATVLNEIHGEFDKRSALRNNELARLRQRFSGEKNGEKSGENEEVETATGDDDE